MKTLQLIFAATSILGAGCSFRSGQESVNVSIALMPSTPSHGIQALAATPANIDGFTCLAVDVSGSDLPGFSNGSCGPAVTSKLVSPLQSNPVSVSLRIPSGPNRKFKMIGVVQSGLDCAQYPNLQSLLQASVGNYPDLYLLGETSQDLFRDTQVEIPNQFNSASIVKPYDNCGSGNLKLNLVGAFPSTSTMDYGFGVVPVVSSPPASYDPGVSSAILTTLKDPANSNPYRVSSNITTGSAAMSFYFAIPSAAQSGYSKARVVGYASGGNDSTSSCMGTDPDQNGGLRIRLAHGTSGWDPAAEGSDFNILGFVNFNLTFNLDAATYKINSSGLELFGDHLVVSVRANSKTGINCSRLAMRSISLELER